MWNARVQAQLIEDVLDVSRMISGKMKLEVRPIELSAVIEQAVEAVLPAVEAKGNSPPARPGSSISGDLNRLQQVVWNLLSNPVKFTPKGGEHPGSLGKDQLTRRDHRHRHWDRNCAGRFASCI